MDAWQPQPRLHVILRLAFLMSSLVFPIDVSLVPLHCCIVFRAVSIPFVFHSSTGEHSLPAALGHLRMWPLDNKLIFLEDIRHEAAVRLGYTASPLPDAPRQLSNAVSPTHIPSSSRGPGGVWWLFQKLFPYSEFNPLSMCVQISFTVDVFVFYSNLRMMALLEKKFLIWG